LGERDRANPKYKLGPAGLQWRAMEWRLLAVSLLSNLFLVLGFTILVIGAVVAALALAPGVPPQRAFAALISTPGHIAVTILVGLIVAAPLVWVICRLITNAPATADQDRVMLFRSWPYTRGAVWPIIGAALVVYLVTIVAGMLGGTINMLLVITREAVPMPLWLEHSIPIALQAALAAGLAPAWYGLIVHIYRAARPAANVAAVFD